MNSESATRHVQEYSGPVSEFSPDSSLLSRWISAATEIINTNSKRTRIGHFCTPLFPRLCYFEMSLQLFAQPPLPPTKLGRYRTLSPLAGVRVSPLQLGAMSIGDKWHQFGMGSMDKESSFKLLDAYFDAGVSRTIALITVIVNCDVVLILFALQGNFIDTANN